MDVLALTALEPQDSHEPQGPASQSGLPKLLFLNILRASYSRSIPAARHQLSHLNQGLGNKKLAVMACEKSFTPLVGPQVESRKAIQREAPTGQRSRLEEKTLCIAHKNVG